MLEEEKKEEGQLFENKIQISESEYKEFLSLKEKNFSLNKKEEKKNNDFEILEKIKEEDNAKLIYNKSLQEEALALKDFDILKENYKDNYAFKSFLNELEKNDKTFKEKLASAEEVIFKEEIKKEQDESILSKNPGNLKELTSYRALKRDLEERIEKSRVNSFIEEKNYDSLNLIEKVNFQLEQYKKDKIKKKNLNLKGV